MTEKQDEAAKNNVANRAGSASTGGGAAGAIVGAGIDHLLFAKDTRDLIYSLRVRGEYRKEAVNYVLKKWVIMSVAFITPSLLVVFYYNSIESVVFSLVLSMLWLLVAYHLRGGIYLLPTTGHIVDGVVQDITFSPRLDVGWTVDYSYEYKGCNAYSGTFFVYYVFKQLSVRVGDHVTVVVDPRNPKKSVGLKSLGFFQPCLSKIQYQRVMQIEDVGL